MTKKMVALVGVLLLLLPITIGGVCDDGNAAPEFEDLAEAAEVATVDEEYEVTVEATDEDDDELTYSLEEAPDGMEIDDETGEITWTPDSSQLGENDVEVKVEDEHGATDTISFEIYVEVGNSAPEITSPEVTTATQNVAYSYDVEATDADTDDTLTFSLDTAPPGMTIDGTTGLIQWIPSVAGSHAVTVRVEDDEEAFDTQPFTITVAAAPIVPTAPSITSTAVTMAQEDQPYSYDVEATDANAGDTLTYSLDTKPDGMTIDSSTGVIAWTPDDTNVGQPNNVTVRVQDSGALSDIQDFTIDVQPTVDKYAVIYGISDYFDPTVGDLNFCDDDANSWYLYLNSKGYSCKVYGHLQASDYSQYDGTASEYNVRNAIRAMLDAADTTDHVAFIASGHGMYGNQLGEANLVMHDYGDPQGGLDGQYWDTELADDFEDCMAAQAFIYIDSCFAAAMAEVATSPSLSCHTIMVASCGDNINSWSWDITQHSHGGWTYFFLIQGLQGAGHEHYDIATNFTWAHGQYHNWYILNTIYGETEWLTLDQPEIFDSLPATAMYV
jgi:hypothetical protein